MPADRRLLQARLVLMIVVSIALPAAPVTAADWKFRTDEHAGIEVNGDARTDAKILATDAPGFYLVELPFESKYVLVNLQSRSAILMMPHEVTRVGSEDPGEVILIDQRSALGTSSYELHSDKRAFDFQTDISSVHVDLQRSKPDKDGGGAGKVSVAPAKPDPAPTAGAASAAEPPCSVPAPVANSEMARACVRLETIRSAPIPGCTQSVFVRNSCDRAVVALVSQTQHLMSGSLSDAISVQVSPQGSSWVACSWWSGAMAPAVHTLVGAGFAEPLAHR